MEEKIEVNDYEMEPNPNGQGMVLNEHEVLKDGLITFNSITLAATLILLIILVSMGINEQGSAGSSDEAGTVLFILIGCIVANIISDKVMSKRFSRLKYKNPAICSEKRFYMEAANAAQNAGFETERSFFTYFSSGRGLVVTKPALFDYSMVIFYDPQSNTFSVANKKRIGRPDLDDLAMLIENQLYSKDCPKIVSAVQKRLELCADSVERCKEENLDSDAHDGLAQGFASNFVKSMAQSAVVTVGAIIIIAIASIL